MNETILTPDRILEVAEDVLRRYGPDKATVVDVARALGVSHGSVYRHFPSKAALRDAVTERWLKRTSEQLRTIAAEDSPATERLRRWFEHLLSAKFRNALNDPELLTTYMRLATESRDVARAHVNDLVAQISQIIADGVARGEFQVESPASTARAVFDATTRFHSPAHSNEWADPEIHAAFEGVWGLMMHGLGAQDSSKPQIS